MISLAATLILLSNPSAPQADLAQSFANPPAWAKPHTWWHWMAGNVTKGGITLDLEAMKYAGIGGAHIFDAGQGIPAGPIAYNSPEWRDLMAFAMKEGSRLGLEMAMHNCSGWSSSGGPWVTPDDAMKKVVWSSSDVDVEATGATRIAMPTPPAVQGYYHRIGVWALETTAKEPAPNEVAKWVGLAGNPGTGEMKGAPVKRVIKIASGESTSNGESTPNLPEGHWRLLELGYTLTGARNVASRPSGEGLEVDKFSKSSLDHFIAGGLEPLFKVIGAPVGKAFGTVVIDSYETGFQNWTPLMISEFKRLRGYDPKDYLPALAGYSIGGTEKTRQFLFDYRRTLADLWSENYAGHYAERLKSYGLKLAVEPYGNGNFDPFTYAKSAGLIMGEYWVGEGVINGSVKASASVAHVYGHSVVGAEALTAGAGQAGWRNQPRQWKPFADRGYTNGINRIIYHRFAHQPWNPSVVPGMTMGPWGSHVDRTETFWSFMPSWDQYLTRCQFMLQSGLYSADVCLFTGEGSPQEYAGQGYELPTVPDGYNFDFCGRDPLMTIQVRDGKLVWPNGASYRVLALPNTHEMTVGLARKIKELVMAGATVVGPKPTSSPSLGDGEKGSWEVELIGEQLWGDGNSTRKVGKGWVVPGTSIEKAFQHLKIGPDVKIKEKQVTWIHRTVGDQEVYFVASQGRNARRVTAHFRVGSKVPEFWNPMDGTRSIAPVWNVVGDGVDVQIPFEADGSTFVVFKNPAASVAHVRIWSSDAKNDQTSKGMLRIVKAEYGVLDQPDKTADVTKQVAERVQGDSAEFNASNDDLGGDPAVNLVKQFRVTYEYRGQTYTVTEQEGSSMNLGAPARDSIPTAEVVSPNGTLYVWQNGTYNLKGTDGLSYRFKVKALPEPFVVEGQWDVRFPAGWDAPDHATFEKLTSWTDNSIFGIKYFSGTAVYTKKITVPVNYRKPGFRLVLDLGDVREMARVKVNGKPVATLWKTPFRVDLGPSAKMDVLNVEVEVTNLWVNRLIGDEQLPDDMGWDGDTLKGWPEWFVKGEPRPERGRKTFTTWHHNRKDTPLLPSGLLGPVVLRPVAVIEGK